MCLQNRVVVTQKVVRLLLQIIDPVEYKWEQDKVSDEDSKRIKV